MPEPVLGRFAEFAAEAAWRDFPDSVWHGAKRCLLDYMAATLPGGAQAPATSLIEAFSDQIGTGSSRLYPGGETTNAKMAALINGAASHTIEFDDIFRDGIYHPGVPVISAALALAEARGLAGKALLRGIISGYEVSNRIARTVNPEHYKYWHTTATIGNFGSAAACATLLGLSKEQTLDALANAGTLAAGLQQAFRSDSYAKPMHGAHAAETGLTCALAAGAGVSGVHDMLEGEVGFGNAMCQGPDWSGVHDGLGEEFTILKMTTKNHAACGHGHAAIDAALEIQKNNSFDLSEISSIQVGSYGPAVDILSSKNIVTAFEARFSIPYMVSVALVTGSCRTDAFHSERLTDQSIQGLVSKVDVYVDEECHAAFPKRRSAKVEFNLQDGRSFSHYARTRKGDPDAPLSDDELSEKYRYLAVPELGEDRATDLERRIWRLDSIENVVALYPAIQRVGQDILGAAD